MTRVVRFVIHNWPLKLAAIALAALLYGGLVLSQSTQPFTGNVPIGIDNPPADVVVLSSLGAVTRIQYWAPPDLGLRIDSQSFRASIDLADVQPTGLPVSMPVMVEAVDPRIQVLDFDPGQIVVTLDRVGAKTVPVRAVIVGPIPSGLDVGDPSVDVETASVRGPQSLVDRVTEVQAQISIDGSGIDVNELTELKPVDAQGESLTTTDTRLEVEPARARVRVPVFTDRRSKTLPVTPNVVGTPAAGFEVESVDVQPGVVSVEGDANDLAGLDRADTAAVSIAGASSQVVQDVQLTLPEGVQPLGSGTVQVTVRLRPVTATRTFEAGLVLIGARADRTYQLSTDRVVVTIGGSVADLDRLSGSDLVLAVDVGGLEPGTHSVTATANLQTGLTLISASPNPIDVVVGAAEPTSPPASVAPASFIAP